MKISANDYFLLLLLLPGFLLPSSSKAICLSLLVFFLGKSRAGTRTLEAGQLD